MWIALCPSSSTANAADRLSHVRTGDLSHEIPVREVALDDVRIGVDHRVVELVAYLAAGKAFE